MRASGRPPAQRIWKSPPTPPNSASTSRSHSSVPATDAHMRTGLQAGRPLTLSHVAACFNHSGPPPVPASSLRLPTAANPK